MSGTQEDTRHGDGVTLRHAISRFLYSYWNRLRGDRPAPLRREIEPADIGPVLSDTFILEVAADDCYPYRLAGTRVCAAFGRELKGENWLDGWSARDREALATLMRTISHDAAGASVEIDGGNGRGQSAPFEFLLLPLVNRGQGYTRILGALAPLDPPYWLGATPLVETIVTALHLIWPHRNDPFREDRAAHPVFDRKTPLRRRRHLALYEGGLE